MPALHILRLELERVLLPLFYQFSPHSGSKVGAEEVIILDSVG